MKVAEYYNQDDDVNKACLEFTKYHRYYVFKKTHKLNSRIKKKEMTKKVLKRKKKKNNLIGKYLLERTNVLDI